MGLRGEPSRDTAVLQPFLSFRGNRAMLANHFRRNLRVEYVFFLGGESRVLPLTGLALSVLKNTRFASDANYIT